jgi:hypothetical protein
MMILKTSRANLSSNDQLSLDLPFAATKSLTARVGPTPVFSRASTGTFVGSNGLIQSAAINIPRFDHTAAGDCRGLLIEESRTNLFSRSEEFDGAYWTKLRASVPTPNTAISPSGSLNADKLVEDASNNTHMVYRILNTGSLAAHTFSVFAKADGRNFVYLDCGDGFPPNSNAYFNLSNGTLGTIGANATATITAFGNGWYRCSITATSTSTATNGFYIQIASANGTRSYQGDGASGIFIWGSQVEAGSFATSYIPTTTGSVVRSVDVCSITGGNFTGMYNQSEGTAVIKFTNADTSGYPQLFSFNQTAAPFANRIYVVGYNRMANTEVGIVTSSVTQLAYIGSLTSKAGNLSLSYKLNDAAYAKDGVIATTDNTVTLGTFIDRLQLQETNGCIASFRYFKKRLPNAQLQTLTSTVSETIVYNGVAIWYNGEGLIETS